ncbi:hypothetical protein SASPL_148092 [Salvia splendens]|uniref:Oxidoreductase molybdopterin-binding domain-containing protein n=1 Tax=Salvia splendens TaxID=180675 RepID=A0A8X8Z3S3_SALSN|nr:hypothetical protein SASPL_148092 [Salvia splendens]
MVKQTIGFNWGAAGVSTSVWRGVPLRAVLKRAGIMNRKKGALNVCFEGAEDLPGGGGSKYGNSCPGRWPWIRERHILAKVQNASVSRRIMDPVKDDNPGFIGGWNGQVVEEEYWDSKERTITII